MPAIVATSGTTAFNPSLGEIALDAFSRVQIRPPSLTADHWFQCRMSALMLQSELSNIGMPLLWKVSEILITLQPGVLSYPLPSNMIAPLDAFIRLYQPGTAQNFAPVFTADADSTLVTVHQPGHGFGAGSMVYFTTAIAASGQVIQGCYLVTSGVDADNYQITVAQPMDGTNSASLPIFTTTLGSNTLSINLPNHSLIVGQSFYCNVPVVCGGLTISGQLVVVGVQDQDHFTVNIGQGAAVPGTATMNGGQAQAKPQAPGVDPTDFILYPVSRTDYVSQPDKGPNLQFRPTTFWVNRQINPVLNFWNAPDDGGPYVLHLFFMAQMDDPVIEGGVGVDIVFRWLATYSAGLAKNLARKYPPPPASGVTVTDLKTDFAELLEAALREDIERTPFFVSPGLQGYYR
jgi:hypothetical protein